MQDEWTFKFTKNKMEEADLIEYQKKLLEIKTKYENYLSKVAGCKFYNGELPPPDNIFAEFKYECNQHEPKCTGWRLYWNPNLVEDKSLLNGSHRNTCAPTRYKVWSKQIQASLELAFFDYFKLFHEGGNEDYYRLSDSYHLSFLPDEQIEDEIEVLKTSE